MAIRIGIITGIVIGLLGIPVAYADITFAGAGTGTESNLAATVNFAISGNDLIITLTNTGPSPALNPPDILTAVFFSVEGNPTLTPVSAVLGAGSQVLFPASGDGTSPEGVVGGEWAYAQGLSAPGGADRGISTAGLGLFGQANFPGDNLVGQTAVGGLEYGLVPLSGTTGGNAPVTGPNPFIQNTAVFTLSFVGDLSLSDITGVSFQYGTSLSEPNIPGNIVPEPASITLFGIGIALMGYRMYRRRIASHASRTQAV